MAVKFYKNKMHWGEGYYKVLDSFTADSGRPYYKALVVTFYTTKITGNESGVEIHFCVYLPEHNLQTQIEESEFLEQLEYAKTYFFQIAQLESPEELSALWKELVAVRSEGKQRKLSMQDGQPLKSATAADNFPPQVEKITVSK